MLFHSPIAIDGLLPRPTFERLYSLHETVHELRLQISSLLSVPLSEDDAAKTFTSDTRLTVGAVELVSDRAALVDLANAYAVAISASIRAAALFSSFGQPQSTPLQQPSVDCQMALLLDNDDMSGCFLKTIQVDWEANLPQPLSEEKSKIKGISLLTLDPGHPR